VAYYDTRLEDLEESMYYGGLEGFTKEEIKNANL